MTPSLRAPYLSVVTTLYCSSQTCVEFVSRMVECLNESLFDYEIIIVDDGCPQSSADVIANSFSGSGHAIRIVRLSRNFGHHPAMMAGLRYSRGSLVFLIDSDLEEPPELVNAFLDSFNKTRCDVVYGVQSSRKGGLLERVLGGWFYNIFNFICSVPLTRNISVVRLMNRKYVDSLLQFGDKRLFMAGAWAYTGYRQEPYIFNKGSRANTTYSMISRLALLAQAIISFSTRPLDIIVGIGLLVSGSGMLLVVYLLQSYLFYAKTPPGFMMIICTQILGFGILLLLQGIVAQYIKIIFYETKQRPDAIVSGDDWI